MQQGNGSVRLLLAVVLLAAGLIAEAATQHATAAERAVRPHRLIALTDIEADPDDTQSLVRLLHDRA